MQVHRRELRVHCTWTRALHFAHCLSLGLVALYLDSLPVLGLLASTLASG